MIDFGSDIPKLSVIAKYADQLDEISPGLVNQMDELVVKNRVTRTDNQRIRALIRAAWFV